jgi:hypothetical protein
VVTDFNPETGKVFTGSSNLAPSGEKGNGDNLIQITDRRVATSYAIEAVRLFDHLHFRSLMRDAEGGKRKSKTKGKKADANEAGKDTTLKLKKPTAISGQPAWYEPYYQEGSQKERDRKLFSR